MRTKETFAVYVFDTTTDALAMEAWCREHGVPGRLIPLPQEISAGCGLAFRMTPQDDEKYRSAMEASGRKFAAVHSVQQFVLREQGEERKR